MRAITTSAFTALCASLTLAGSAPAGAAQLIFKCINSANGVRMMYSVDDRLHTVNGTPAEITDDHVAWQNKTDGGSYDLHRASGNLTVRNAGRARFHRCDMQSGS